MSIRKNVIDYLCHTSSIAILSSVVRLTSLEPETSSPQLSGLCKVQKEDLLKKILAINQK